LHKNARFVQKFQREKFIFLVYSSKISFFGEFFSFRPSSKFTQS